MRPTTKCYSPLGLHQSIKECAAAHGIWHSVARQRLNSSNFFEWYYADGRGKKAVLKIGRPKGSKNVARKVIAAQVEVIDLRTLKGKE